MLNALGRLAMKSQFVRSAVYESADLSIFKRRPGTRVYVGIVIFLLNYVFGWPAVALFGFLAAYFKNPYILIVGGPVIYGISWLMLFAGVYLAGVDYTRATTRWLVRKSVERVLGFSQQEH